EGGNISGGSKHATAPRGVPRGAVGSWALSGLVVSRRSRLRAAPLELDLERGAEVLLVGLLLLVAEDAEDLVQRLLAVRGHLGAVFLGQLVGLLDLAVVELQLFLDAGVAQQVDAGAGAAEAATEPAPPGPLGQRRGRQQGGQAEGGQRHSQGAHRVDLLEISG